jgi:hypothetical protein
MPALTRRRFLGGAAATTAGGAAALLPPSVQEALATPPTRTLHFGRQAPAPVMPDAGGNLNLATYEVANLPTPAFPGAKQTVPHQERGRQRPHA